MADLIEFILASIILTPIILINIFFTVGSIFQKLVSQLTQKILKTDSEFKSSSRKIFSFINIIVWILVGGINVYFLDEPLSLGAAIVFLTFHSGFSVSKRFIFGIHDSRILKDKYKGKVSKILSNLVKIGIIIEILFLLLITLLNRYLSISIKSSLGIQVNILVFILWIAGFIYGIISSVILSSRTNQFLGKNEIGIAILLSGEIIKDKIEKKKRSFQNFIKQ